MKYPYIGELKDGSSGVVLFAANGYGAQLNSKGHGWESEEELVYFGAGHDDEEWEEDEFTNITTEYLSNTYGEVKSKEHAEFIQLLAEANEMNCSLKYIDASYGCFYFIGCDLFFCHDPIDAEGEYRQITIPLPPELDCKESKPKKVLSNGRVYNLLECGFYSGTYYDTGDINSVRIFFVSLETLKEASDFKVIEVEVSNSSWPECPDLNHSLDAIKEQVSVGDKEWPKVGDEVEVSTGAGVVVLGPDNGGLYIIDIDGDYAVRDINGIKKPKTPEQELRDSLSGLILAQHRELLGCDDVTPTTLMRMADDSAEILTKTHNITKKTQ